MAVRVTFPAVRFQFWFRHGIGVKRPWFAAAFAIVIVARFDLERMIAGRHDPVVRYSGEGVFSKRHSVSFSS